MANEAASATPVYTVTSAPFWHCGRTTKLVMLETILALMPAAIMAVYRFGPDALRVMALACVTAVITQYLCERAMERPSMVDNYHALLVGLLFSFLLPSTAPWWLVVVGSIASMTLGNMVFGGLGASPVCAPVVGWAVLSISWPDLMDVNGMLLNWDLIRPVSDLKYFGLDSVRHLNYADLLMGKQLEALGAAQTGTLLLGGVYLMIRGHLKPYIPLAFIVGVLAVGGLYTAIDSTAYASPIFQMLTGSTMLAAFFLAPDSTSSPAGRTAMILYGLIAGSLVIIIRTYGVYPDGVPFAILLANMLTPLLDLIQPKPFGGR